MTDTELQAATGTKPDLPEGITVAYTIPAEVRMQINQNLDVVEIAIWESDSTSLLCLCVRAHPNQSAPCGDTVEDTEQSLQDLMAQMKKL